MTEDEAKTKWCPFSRPVSLGKGIVYMPEGRDVVGEQGMEDHCIASACMAWRWTTKPKAGREFSYKEIDHPTLADHKTSTPVAGRAPVIGRGYCGLAGAPQ